MNCFNKKFLLSTLALVMLVSFFSVETAEAKEVSRSWAGSIWAVIANTFTSVSDGEEIVSTCDPDCDYVFNSLTDYSGEQGYRGWYYQYFDQRTGYQEMRYNEEMQIWFGDHPKARLWKRMAHPYKKQDAVRSWKAPRGGDIKLKLTYADDGRSCSLGVEFSVYHNNKRIFAAVRNAGMGQKQDQRIDLSLREGDWLRFHVRPQGSVSCEKSLFTQKIEYKDRPTPSPSEKPNFIIILADDLNDWLNYMGSDVLGVSPNIDRLSESSVVFSDAHAASPLCNASRTNLLTGRSAEVTGTYLNADPENPIGFEMWPDRLREAGYYTLGVGKTTQRNVPGLWDTWKHFQKSPEPKNAPVVGPDRALDVAILEDAVPDDMQDYKAAKWLGNQLKNGALEEPFVVFFGTHAPHSPYYLPMEYFHRNPNPKGPTMPESDLDDLPEDAVAWLNEKEDELERDYPGLSDKLRQGYLAMISFLDDVVGEVVDGYEKSPYTDNTVIIFASDQGYHLGEKGHWFKWTPYRDVSRIPLLIKGPGHSVDGDGSTSWQQPMKINQTVSLLDIWPTMAELAGVNSGVADGESLVTLLNNPETEREGEALLSTYRDNYGEVRALSSGRYRYIRWHKGGEELYDIILDPQEWKNLASDPGYTGVLGKMRAKMDYEIGKLQ